LLGDYFEYREDEREALRDYNITMKKEIATLNEKDAVTLKILQVLDKG